MKKLNFFKAAAISALVSLVALTGCNNATSAAAGSNYSATGQIFGYVTDTKGEPLSGVTIALGNQTTTTNANGAFALTGVPANATQNTNGGITEATNTTNDKQKYVLTATKDGYLSNKVDNIYVVETTDKSDIATLLKAVKDDFKTILEAFAKGAGATPNTVTANNVTATDGVVLNTQNTNDTFKPISEAEAALFDKYLALSKTYESTFVKTSLTPCNGWFEGTLKITKSPAKNITTDAASIKAAPEGVKVKLVSSGNTGNNDYVYETTTDKDGNFKFVNLPVNTTLVLKVEGFVGTYESGEGENKVTEKFYYSLPDSTTAAAAEYTYPGVDLPEDKLTIKLDENSGAKFNATVLLYYEPEKIIVTNTNLLQNTVVAPLALNTPVTVEFNKAMDYVKLETATATAPATVHNVSELGDKATYLWDDTKKKVTITPKDGYWTSDDDTVTFLIKGRALDGATEFIDNKFEVKLDNVIKVVFADASDATADKFTLTFDRELVKTDAVKVTDDKPEALDLSWDKTNAAAPVLTVKARDGKFATNGEHTFTITGVEAKDESKTITSYSREYEKTTAGAYTFKTRFDGFKATSIEVVDKAEGALSRAVVATTAQYLKINFNKNLGDVSGLTVKDGTGTTANTITVNKYVKDNALYISLSEFADNNDIAISGTVYSASGDAFDGTGDVKWVDLLKNYKVRTAYVIAASNLYVEKASINAGNDNTVTTIKKGDNVTLTFNKDIPTDAVIETEVYVYENNKLVKMDETGYKATYAAAGKVVTLTLSETKPGTTYYLSLKIKSKDGAVLFSTGSKSFATGTPVKDLYIEPSITHTFPATAAGATANAWDGKKYIKIEVASVKLLPEGSSKTTKAADFKKVSNGTIVLQFNQNVTGYSAYLYKVPADTTAANNLRTALKSGYINLNNDNKSNFYGITTSVSEDTITIKPNGSFPSAEKPAIALFDADGNWVELNYNSAGTVVDAAFQPYEAKTYADKLRPDEATLLTGFTIATTKTSGYTAGETPKFSLKMFAANKYTASLPTLTLYKKVDNGYGDVEWVEVGTQTIYKEEASTNAYNDYSFYKVDNATAYFTASAGAEITYGSEDLIVLSIVDNLVVKSNKVTISK